jgi:hypothetical protein
VRYTGYVTIRCKVHFYSEKLTEPTTKSRQRLNGELYPKNR